MHIKMFFLLFLLVKKGFNRWPSLFIPIIRVHLFFFLHTLAVLFPENPKQKNKKYSDLMKTIRATDIDGFDVLGDDDEVSGAAVQDAGGRQHDHDPESGSWLIEQRLVGIGSCCLLKPHKLQLFTSSLNTSYLVYPRGWCRLVAVFFFKNFCFPSVGLIPFI